MLVFVFRSQWLPFWLPSGPAGAWRNRLRAAANPLDLGQDAPRRGSRRSGRSAPAAASYGSCQRPESARARAITSVRTWLGCPSHRLAVSLYTAARLVFLRPARRADCRGCWSRKATCRPALARGCRPRRRGSGSALMPKHSSAAVFAATSSMTTLSVSPSTRTAPAALASAHDHEACKQRGSLQPVAVQA